MEKQPPTIAIQATDWWEAAVAHVKLQQCGLGVHLPVTVTTLLSCCIYYNLTCPDSLCRVCIAWAGQMYHLSTGVHRSLQHFTTVFIA